MVGAEGWEREATLSPLSPNLTDVSLATFGKTLLQCLFKSTRNLELRGWGWTVDAGLPVLFVFRSSSFCDHMGKEVCRKTQDDFIP